jgi:hypothetical protein
MSSQPWSAQQVCYGTIGVGQGRVAENLTVDSGVGVLLASREENVRGGGLGGRW